AFLLVSPNGASFASCFLHHWYHSVGVLSWLVPFYVLLASSIWCFFCQLVLASWYHPIWCFFASWYFASPSSVIFASWCQ
ncbi:22844_t:CDS:1, partial [Racocetra persica]